jgi:hypothetical protein
MIELLKRLLTILGINYAIRFGLSMLRLPSGLVLVLVNLIPLFGTLFLGWNAYDIIFLYWFENIVAGFYTVLKMGHARGDTATSVNTNLGQLKAKPAVIQFFVIHYGMFTFVHGIFVVFVVASKSNFLINREYLALGVFFFALLLSHGFSFWSNYLGRKEYLQKAPADYFFKPYGRIILIHLVILIPGFAGDILYQLGFAAEATELPVSATALIVVFVLFKIVIDLSMHLSSHGFPLKFRLG